jgi:FG-GAP repeat
LRRERVARMSAGSEIRRPFTSFGVFGNQWTEVAKVMASDGQAGSEFGHSLAAHGKMIAVLANLAASATTVCSLMAAAVSIPLKRASCYRFLSPPQHQRPRPYRSPSVPPTFVCPHCDAAMSIVETFARANRSARHFRC